jgi:hypothetical protein
MYHHRRWGKVEVVALTGARDIGVPGGAGGRHDVLRSSVTFISSCQ